MPLQKVQGLFLHNYSYKFGLYFLRGVFLPLFSLFTFNLPLPLFTPSMNKQEFNKNKINNRHIELLNKSLDAIEFILENFVQNLPSDISDPLDLSKNTITTLDFLISSVSKIQKAHRIALGLDSEVNAVFSFPKINIDKQIDVNKI